MPSLDRQCRIVIDTDSGIHSPIKGERWEAILEHNNKNYMSYIVPNSPPVEVGAPFLAGIMFFDPEYAKQYFEKGDKFLIRAAKIVGSGEIL